MRFSRWHRLAQLPNDLPRYAGVFQVRLETGLVDYPSGRSAMVFYGHAEDLKLAITRFSSQHAGMAWLVRYNREAVTSAQARCERLVDDFKSRFGSVPHPP